jgi:DNA-binding beta-propeller fold protein YncE
VAGTGSSGSVDAVGTSASFNGPIGMSTSPDGSFVLIADYNNHKIRKLIVSTGVVSTFAGSGSAGGANGVGTVAALFRPYDIAISSDGSFVVSTCQFGHRIRHIVMSTALVTTLAGDGVAGSTNGVGTSSRFNYPTGVSLSNIDNTFALIADFYNHMIRKIVLSTKVVTRVAGSGTAGAANGIGTLTTMNRPYFIALSSDDVFAVISEWTGHRIRKLVLSTWAVTTVAGSPTSATGAADGAGTLASFNGPAGVLLTSDDLMVYVADRLNHKIRRVELSSQRVSTVVAASGSVALNEPVGLTWIEADLWLMISSYGSNRLHEMYGTCAAPTGQPTGEPTGAPTIYTAPNGLFCDVVSQVVVAGTGSTGSVDAVGTSASFNVPAGMSTSPDGSFVLITDYLNHKIRKLIVSTGVVSTFAGSGSAGGANGVGTVADLYNPYGIAISSDGSFAVSICHRGHLIRHVVMSTALVTTLAGDGVIGSTNGVGTNARFNGPVGVCLSNIDYTFALIADRDNHIIRKIVLSTKVVTRVAGSGTSGAANGIGTLATMTAPFFIALSADDVFAVISEWTGHRIRKLVLSTWAVTTVAGSPTSATGAADGAGTLASFNGPAGVLLTSDDLMVYVADRGNNKIRRVELSSQRVSTVVAASGSVALNQPTGLTWIEADQWLMVVNVGSNRLHEMYGTCAAPTGEPTSDPTQPTYQPTGEPSAAPSSVPTSSPTVLPTACPTAAPSATPTAAPTVAPTSFPSFSPTAYPSAAPTAAPTAAPSSVPTASPTAMPTSAPTAAPTPFPSSYPTA